MKTLVIYKNISGGFGSSEKIRLSEPHRLSPKNEGLFTFTASTQRFCPLGGLSCAEGCLKKTNFSKMMKRLLTSPKKVSS